MIMWIHYNWGTLGHWSVKDPNNLNGRDRLGVSSILRHQQRQYENHSKPIQSGWSKSMSQYVQDLTICRTEGILLIIARFHSFGRLPETTIGKRIITQIIRLPKAVSKNWDNWDGLELEYGKQGWKVQLSSNICIKCYHTIYLYYWKRQIVRLPMNTILWNETLSTTYYW